MANELTNTELAARIPEVWPSLLIAATYDEDSLLPRVLNAAEFIGGKGDIVHIATEPTLTAVSVSADGSVANSQQTVGDVSLTVDKHYAVIDEVLRKTKAQSIEDWFNAWPKAAGKALRQQISKDLLSLYSGVTTNVAGDGSAHANEDDLLAAMGKLIEQALPIHTDPGSFTFVFDNEEYAPLKKQGFLEYSKTGEAGMGGAATSKLSELWGIPCYFNRQVVGSASINYNLLFHKTWAAAAVQKNVTFDKASGLANLKLTDVMAADVLYGVKTVLESRACQIRTLDS